MVQNCKLSAKGHRIKWTTICFKYNIMNITSIEQYYYEFVPCDFVPILLLRHVSALTLCNTCPIITLSYLDDFEALSGAP